MLQVWNEMQQDFNSKICENCQHFVSHREDSEVGFCLRITNDETIDNMVAKDWYCKGIED